MELVISGSYKEPWNTCKYLLFKRRRWLYNFWFEWLTGTLNSWPWLIWISQVWLGKCIYGELSWWSIYIKSAPVREQFPFYFCSTLFLIQMSARAISCCTVNVQFVNVCVHDCTWCAVSKHAFQMALGSTLMKTSPVSSLLPSSPHLSIALPSSLSHRKQTCCCFPPVDPPDPGGLNCTWVSK